MNIYSFVVQDHVQVEPKVELREQELLCNVPSNTVQSIRAFRLTELQSEAARLEQHFLYAYCGDATTKHQVLALIASAFHFPKHFGKNFDALSDCLTSMMFKASYPTRLNSIARRVKRCWMCSAMRPIFGPTRKSPSASSIHSSSRYGHP